MLMAPTLTRNGIAAVNAGDLDLKPVVQVMEVTKMVGSQERFRILVSDGSTSQQALLTGSSTMWREKDVNYKKILESGSYPSLAVKQEREFDACEYRYLLQAQVQDHTGVVWVTAFQESGEDILGCTAKELFLLRLKIKEEHYGEEQRVKITVVKAERVNPSTESRYLLEEITKVQ
ncbi:hypothetical protein HPP92_018763 [Vanilla planifolia]|uniref:Uncharacterized protein n=1 Tax=Vanilla planifolia TaxID=51239 RepID=A0A835Q2S4_VANPL|nr:hypothetical protein HPP92_018763 [Vanilla planifolia]